MVQSSVQHSDRLGALVEQFATLLAQRGLHPALGFLNARTRHRFTGVYRFDPPMLRNIALFDRENPTLCLGNDTPMRETYCSLICRDAAPFATDDAGADARLSMHPARGSVIAYCGVPIMSEDRAPVGSLCHFDLRPRLTSLAEIPLLQRAAPLVMHLVAQPRQPA